MMIKKLEVIQQMFNEESRTQEAISSDKVEGIFEAAGLNKPEISKLEILSDEFLLEVQGIIHKN